ncbi:hypothetical protein BDGGKGIB_02978 [Nodularia sphaerocarpa UHCC 0038]|nr:hypothetical protein BDGGKGIB_02978 [Nodularia sphaerocarpa UHCC 0038]
MVRCATRQHTLQNIILTDIIICVYTVAPARREALNFPPSLVGKGVRGLGFALAFPHNVKSPDEKKAVKSITIYNGFSLYNLTLDGLITAKQNRFLYLVNC